MASSHWGLSCGHTLMSTGAVLIWRLITSLLDVWEGCHSYLILALSWDFSGAVHSFFHVIFLCGLGIKQYGGWVLGFIPRASISKDPGRYCKAFYHLASILSEYRYYHILFMKEVTKISPDSRWGDVDLNSSCGKQQLQRGGKKLRWPSWECIYFRGFIWLNLDKRLYL